MRLKPDEKSKSANRETQKVQKLGLIEVIQAAIRRDGILSFYKGMYMALLGTVVSFGSYFYVYRLLKNMAMYVLRIRSEH